MTAPTYDDIAARAYQHWEARGRPDDPAAAALDWRAAEEELQREFSEGEGTAKRETGKSNVTTTALTETLFVVVDRGHFRAYLEEIPLKPGGTPATRLIEALDLLQGHEYERDRVTDPAGRFGNRTHVGGGEGASIDERLPEKEELERRTVGDLVGRIEDLLTRHRYATWFLAAPPALCHPILEKLSSAVRERLRRSIAKDLTKFPAHELRGHFE
jgi:hypothetical protein